MEPNIEEKRTTYAHGPRIDYYWLLHGPELELICHCEDWTLSQFQRRHELWNDIRFQDVQNKAFAEIVEKVRK